MNGYHEGTTLQSLPLPAMALSSGQITDESNGDVSLKFY